MFVKSPCKDSEDYRCEGVMENLTELVVSLYQYYWGLSAEFVAGDLCKRCASVVYLVLATWVGLPREVIKASTDNTEHS